MTGKCYFGMFSLVTAVAGHLIRSTKTYLPLVIKGSNCTLQYSFYVVKMSSDFQLLPLYRTSSTFFFFITVELLISLFCKPSLKINVPCVWKILWWKVHTPLFLVNRYCLLYDMGDFLFKWLTQRYQIIIM